VPWAEVEFPLGQELCHEVLAMWTDDGFHG
jgi:hypothetical protein